MNAANELPDAHPALEKSFVCHERSSETAGHHYPQRPGLRSKDMQHSANKPGMNWFLPTRIKAELMIFLVRKGKETIMGFLSIEIIPASLDSHLFDQWV